ncbi:MAG: aminomethyl-transferring glycine dehydrogenase [Chitinophagales bacterium]
MQVNTQFLHRHIGPNAIETQKMLDELQLSSIEQLIEQTVPASIRLKKELPALPAKSEFEYLKDIKKIANKNQLWRSYIGLGYYGTIMPSVVQRNIFENPSWYTQYTPYQAEIAQGRLEALLNFQTMVSDLTGMEIANASLLDEGTAAAEAMLMTYRIKNKRKKKNPATRFLLSENCLPTTIDVLKTRAEPLGIQLEITAHQNFTFDDNTFGCLLQYPTAEGAIYDYEELAHAAHQADVFVIAAADLMSLCLLKEPAAWGADIAIGTTQRFGVPMAYGGPHAAYFATSDKYIREIPGRVIGISLDKNGEPAYRMALQTREQHIKRGKATSNICTAQALLAIIAGAYAVYHGAAGLTNIAQNIQNLTTLLHEQLTKLGYKQVNEQFFDTLLIDLRKHTTTSGLRVRRVADFDEVNFRYFEDSDLIGISLDETCTIEDVKRIVQIFAEAVDVYTDEISIATEIFSDVIDENLKRKSPFLQHPTFNTHRSETQMLRYLKKLENRDLSLANSMIPLGSCTMKLNATTQLMPLSYESFSQIHPFVPMEQAAGYQQIFTELEQHLCDITGFDACSLQPNSGAQGEYTGLMVIRAFHLAQGNAHRNIAIIPSSAHGTNPASAVMAGMKVIVVKCDKNGNIDVVDLKAKAEKHSENLAALMITYPSTHGVFEEPIKEICETIHQHGGQVYMDGANMNAQVGLTSPATIGADVCHLNLHKTFSIPHGGGGPGMGPICVAAHLAEFLPTHIFAAKKSDKAISAVSSAAWSSASILLISYAYIKLLGNEGLKKASEYAILNANYIKSRLEKYYDVLYVGENGRVAHELILDFRPFKRAFGIDVTDVAKRLMDYGFHAPTMSFPVAGTMMIEPTESEDLAEIERFIAAMISIRQEIRDVELGISDNKNNVLTNAPHTLAMLMQNDWPFSYEREQAAFPLPYLRDNKFWPSVARVDNTYGDRNLICTCPPVEAYSEV